MEPNCKFILMPDTDELEDINGCRMRPGRAVRREEPVIAPTLPCEGVACYVYGSVIKYGGWYRIWHQAVIPNFGDAVCHSLSRDGITWNRPLFGGTSRLRQGSANERRAPTVDSLAFPEQIASWPGLYEGKNNIAACLHNPVVIRPDCKDPYPGLYKIIGFTDRGYVAGFSKDGRKFRYAEENPVIPLTWYLNPNTGKRWANDVGIPFWDDRGKRYVGMIKTYEIDDRGRTRRCIGRSESPDLLHWAPVETIWRPGESDDAVARSKGFNWADFYGLPTFPYGNGYLGFLWFFMIDHELPKGTNVGKIEVYMAWSRDTVRWERVSDEPIFSNPPDGEWGCAVFHTASQPVRERDHEKVYFAASDRLHGAWEIGLPPLGAHPYSIGVATLPKNGFCRIWAEDGGFSVAIPRDERTASKIAITFSAEGGSPTATVCRRGVDGPLFAGPVTEGQRKTLRLADGEGPVDIRLENCGVYSVELL